MRSLILTVALVLINLAGVAQGSVTLNGELLENLGDGSSRAPPFTEEITVPANTSLMLCAALRTGNEVESAVSWNTSEALTQIYEDTATSSTDAGLSIWGIVDPTATTADIVFSTSTGDWDNYSAFTCYAWAGTVTTSVAAATNVGTAVEDKAGSTSACAIASSEGTAGNINVLYGTAFGNDMQPASNDVSFTELLDASDGGGNSDGAYYVAYGDAPSQPTLSWATTDENLCVQVEILAAPSTLDLIIYRRLTDDG
jgi:hypothetical protein